MSDIVKVNPIIDLYDVLSLHNKFMELESSGRKSLIREYIISEFERGNSYRIDVIVEVVNEYFPEYRHLVKTHLVFG